jgi:Flp pilus assembly protein TadB
MSANNESFSYTYSAKQQEEVKKIRDKYITREENKMEMLRRLDKSVEQSGVIVSLVVGIISSLILGTGMACIIEWTDLFIVGLAVGIIGIIGMALAYPIYKIITKKQREKIMPRIIELSNELMNGNNQTR